MARSVEINVTATATLIGMVAPLLAAAPDGQALFFDDPRAGQKFFGAYGATQGGPDRPGAKLAGRGRQDRAEGSHPDPARHAHRHPRPVLPRRGPRRPDHHPRRGEALLAAL